MVIFLFSVNTQWFMNNYGEHPKIQWFMIYLKVFDELILTHYLPQKEKEKTYIVEYLYIYVYYIDILPAQLPWPWRVTRTPWSY